MQIRSGISKEHDSPSPSSQSGQTHLFPFDYFATNQIKFESYQIWISNMGQMDYTVHRKI